MIHPFKIPLKRLTDNTFPRALETVSQFVIRPSSHTADASRDPERI